MKIQITEQIDKAIEGYKVVPVLYGKMDMNIIPNNAATKIIAIDAMDSIPFSSMKEFLNQIRIKMRTGCELIIGGSDITMLSRDVINGKIECEKYNNMIYKKRGVYNVNQIVNTLESLGLNILNVVLKGYNYEITATRPEITN